MEFLTKLPIGLIFSALSLASAWAVVKYKINEMKKEIQILQKLRTEDKDLFFKVRDEDNKNILDKFENVEFKREKLKDTLISKMHDMSLKITEIHTIITKN